MAGSRRCWSVSAPRNGSCLRRVIRRGADRDKTALEMERLDAETRFDTLVAAARKYLADGRDPASLTPLAVQKLGLLPPNWVSDPDVATNNGLWLGPRDGGLIGVGVVGSYEALAPRIAKYRDGAVQIYFPYPRALAGNPKVIRSCGCW